MSNYRRQSEKRSWRCRISMQDPNSKPKPKPNPNPISRAPLCPHRDPLFLTSATKCPKFKPNPVSRRAQPGSILPQRQATRKNSKPNPIPRQRDSNHKIQTKPNFALLRNGRHPATVSRSPELKPNPKSPGHREGSQSKSGKIQNEPNSPHDAAS